MAAFRTCPAQPACLDWTQRNGVWPKHLAVEEGDAAGCSWALGEDEDGATLGDRRTPALQPGRGELSTGQLSPRPWLSAGCFGQTREC